MTEKKLIPYLFLVFSLFFASYSFAAEVHFQWGASSGVVDGYRIYYGFTHQGPYPNLLVEVGGTTTDYTATLDEGVTYYLVVRAYNNYGESGSSNEVVWPSDDPDLTPPRDITNAHMIGFDGSNLELGWTNPTSRDEYCEPIPENQDFQGVMIRYNIGYDAPYPANYTEGILFGDEPGNLDENDSCMGTIISGTYYKFSFFTHDADGHYSTAVHLLVDAKLPPVNVPPTIDSFTGIPASLNNPGETITFNVSATDPDGDSLTYTINFGDGTASESGSEAIHTYASAGTYDAEVTVDDGHDHIVGKSLQITVNDVPPAKPTGVTVN